MRLSLTSRWKIGFGILVALTAIFAFWPFYFSYDSVCSLCGAIQQTTRWHLPHSQHSFYKRSGTKPTALSSYLTSSGIVAAHEHQWLFGYGGGNDIFCALGPGDGIRATVTSAKVARLLSMSRQFGDPKKFNELMRYAFDPGMSRTVLRIAARMPLNGFTSTEAYQSWFTDQSSLINDALEMAKQSR